MPPWGPQGWTPLGPLQQNLVLLPAREGSGRHKGVACATHGQGDAGHTSLLMWAGSVKVPALTGPPLQRDTVPATRSRDVTARPQCHGHTHKSPFQQRGMSSARIGAAAGSTGHPSAAHILAWLWTHP